jgi:hypothetical protein
MPRIAACAPSSIRAFVAALGMEGVGFTSSRQIATPGPVAVPPASRNRSTPAFSRGPVVPLGTVHPDGVAIVQQGVVQKQLFA